MMSHLQKSFPRISRANPRFVQLTTALATGRTEYGARSIRNDADYSTDTERVLVVSFLDK